MEFMKNISTIFLRQMMAGFHVLAQILGQNNKGWARWVDGRQWGEVYRLGGGKTAIGTLLEYL